MLYIIYYILYIICIICIICIYSANFFTVKSAIDAQKSSVHLLHFLSILKPKCPIFAQNWRVFHGHKRTEKGKEIMAWVVAVDLCSVTTLPVWRKVVRDSSEEILLLLRGPIQKNVISSLLLFFLEIRDAGRYDEISILVSAILVSMNGFHLATRMRRFLSRIWKMAYEISDKASSWIHLSIDCTSSFEVSRRATRNKIALYKNQISLFQKKSIT